MESIIVLNSLILLRIFRFDENFVRWVMTNLKVKNRVKPNFFLNKIQRRMTSSEFRIVFCFLQILIEFHLDLIKEIVDVIIC